MNPHRVSKSLAGSALTRGGKMAQPDADSQVSESVKSSVRGTTRRSLDRQAGRDPSVRLQAFGILKVEEPVGHGLKPGGVRKHRMDISFAVHDDQVVDELPAGDLSHHLYHNASVIQNVQAEYSPMLSVGRLLQVQLLRQRQRQRFDLGTVQVKLVNAVGHWLHGPDRVVPYDQRPGKVAGLLGLSFDGEKTS